MRKTKTDVKVSLALLPIHLHVIVDALSHRLFGESTSIHRKFYKGALDVVTNELMRIENIDPDHALRYGLIMPVPKRNWVYKTKPPVKKPANKRRTKKPAKRRKTARL